MRRASSAWSFTLTTWGALEALVAARKALPSDALLGVGTIRTVQHVTDSFDAGADFLVNQAFKAGLVEAARRGDVPFILGTLTPIEIVTAWEFGVPAIKVSPIGPVGGLHCLAELRGPLPDIPLVPTGGVTIADAAAYLEGGAMAVGVSRDLIGDALAFGGDLAALSKRAERLDASTARLRRHLSSQHTVKEHA